MQQSSITSAEMISNEMILSYQEQGFIHIPNLLTQAEVSRYHAAAVDAASTLTNLAAKIPQVFTQTVNVWRDNLT
ncbi:MAG: hypothetical protein IH586_17935, partial [Anaerolineaceae bacterium]|nr:hypothetical protein [Anaerolineaceae bacterium]